MPVTVDGELVNDRIEALKHARDDDASPSCSSIRRSQGIVAPMTAPQPYRGVPGFALDDTPAPSKPTRLTKPNSDTVTLRGVAVPLNSDVGGAFVTDCARNRERLFNDDQIQEKYEINPDAWVEITQNKALRLAITRECERRMLNNDAAREAAAKQFTKAPEILGGILEDQKANPRHRIEAAKELRSAARVGDEKTGDTPERVIISINLGADERLVVDSGPLPPKRIKEAIDAETER